MKSRILLVAVILVSLLVIIYTNVAFANGGTAFYVCRSGLSQGFVCRYSNLYGQSKVAWNGVAITPSMFGSPLSGTWVLEYR